MVHRRQHGLMGFVTSEEFKTVITLLAIELIFLLFVSYKGRGSTYLGVTVVIAVATVIGCAITFYINADRYFLIASVLMLNLGFMVQGVDGLEFSGIVHKLAPVLVLAFAAGAVFYAATPLLMEDKIAVGLVLLQIVLFIALFICGKATVGTEAGAQATLTLNIGGVDFQPMEFIKVIYVFVMAVLVCKDDRKPFVIAGHSISGEWMAVPYTAVLCLMFIVNNEFGSLLVMYLTGLLMLLIFGHNRKLPAVLTILTGAGLTVGWIVSAVVYPAIYQDNGKSWGIPGTVFKLIERFGVALHPERFPYNGGYQGTMALEGIAVGGVFGPETDRYMIYIPQSETDMIFSNLVQTCGVVMGIVLIVAVFALLVRGMAIARHAENWYYRGIAVGLTFLIVIQNTIHIAYNNAAFAITGIPLYYVSQGFTAILSTLVMTAVLMVISAGSVKRSTRR